MSPSPPIALPFTPESAVEVLAQGARPDGSPYSHAQIAEWCDRFWCRYLDVDAPPEIGRLLPVLADVEVQWTLFLANTCSMDALRAASFDEVRLPAQWFERWLAEAKG